VQRVAGLSGHRRSFALLAQERAGSVGKLSRAD